MMHFMLCCIKDKPKQRRQTHTKRNASSKKAKIFINKMREKNHTVGIVPNYNRHLVEAESCMGY